MGYIFSIIIGLVFGLLFWQFLKGGKSDLIRGIIITALGAWFGGFVVLYLGITVQEITWGAIIIAFTAVALFFIMQTIVGKNNKKKNKDQINDEISKDDWPVIKDKIKLRFEKISSENMESLKENFELLSKVLQETYGYAKEQADKEFKSFKESLR